jgi:hypothetical protein
MSRKLILLAACGALAIGGCETVNEVGDASEFVAQLSGANEVPPADPDGAGFAEMSFNDTTNTFCTDLEVRQISPATAAHVHRGAAGANGPVVIPIDTPDDDDSDDCRVIDDALGDEITNNPGGFYVNVHTADYPDGAIRGQLRRQD